MPSSRLHRSRHRAKRCRAARHRHERLSSPRTRAVSPALGTVLLVAITVVLAGTIAVMAGSLSLAATEPSAALELEADADRNELVFDHAGGDDLDVRDLEVRVTVEDEPLDHQPPVPFVGAPGFRGSPSGPFNAESSPEWRTGERATLRLAGTNEPRLEVGDVVRVTISSDGQTVARLVTVAC